MAQIDDILNSLVRKNAFKAIEKLMEPDTELACLTLLAIYTEMLGTLYSITVEKTEDGIIYKKPSGGYETFEKCLEYMGDEYVKVNEEMKLHNQPLSSIVRNGVTHEFEPKLSYLLKINNPITSSIGFEYLAALTLKINLQEYFRDLKAGFNKWRDELEGDFDKQIAVLRTSRYVFPPQGGIGVILDGKEEFVFKIYG